MQIETTTNTTMLKSMLSAVMAQIDRTSDEEEALLAELIGERDRVMARINVLGE